MGEKTSNTTTQTPWGTGDPDRNGGHRHEPAEDRYGMYKRAKVQDVYGFRVGWTGRHRRVRGRQYVTTPPPPVLPADFALSVSPAAVTQQVGEVGTPLSVAVAGLHGFSGSVSVSLSGLPSGTTSTPASPFTIAANATQDLTFTIPASTTVGDSNVSLSGTSGTLSHSTPLKLTVTAAKDFSLSVSSAQIAATIGDISQAATVSVTGVNGFSEGDNSWHDTRHSEQLGAPGNSI